jgi:hypothetical protein
VKVRAFIGRQGSENPLNPFVVIEDEDGFEGDWMTPQQARGLAKKLTKAADMAQAKYQAKIIENSGNDNR